MASARRTTVKSSNSSAHYQALADAAKADAEEAGTVGQRERHEESRKNWQRLADQANRLETAKAERLAGEPS